MPRDTASSTLQDYIEGTLLNGTPVDADDNLLLTGMIDSLGIMSLVAFMETAFSIQIPFDDVVIENFMSISAMTNYVNRRQTQTV